MALKGPPSDDAACVISNNKTGTVLTTSLHCICAIIGAGVLSLPHAVAWLGWIAGPTLIIVFYLVALLTSRMLVSCYHVDGKEYGRYHHLVSCILSRNDAIVVSVFQLLTLFLVNLAYTITAASTASDLAQSICNLTSTPLEDCFDKTWVMTLLFGAVEAVLSQVRNLEEAWWVSLLGVLCSLTYTLICLGVGASQASNGLGSIGGISATPVKKAFGVLNSMGNIAFAFSVSQILLEVQDTLHQPPNVIKQGKLMCNIAVTVSFMAYFAVAVTGYAAYGNDVQGIILSSFDSNSSEKQIPQWVIIVANVAVILHMVFAFQVLAQPVFETIESHVKWALLKRAEKKEALEGEQGVGPGKDEDEEDSEAAITKRIPPAVSSGPSMTMLGLAKHSMAPIDERMSYTMSRGLSSALSRRASSRIQPTASRTLEEEGVINSPLSFRESRPPPMAMFSIDTGFANEEVPLNSENVLAPLWVRLLLRSAYVGLLILIGVIMPFFTAVVGLIGSLTFWPLVIYYPLKVYFKVYTVSPRRTMLLKLMSGAMLIVSVAAMIASIYNIVVGWSTFKIFD